MHISYLQGKVYSMQNDPSSPEEFFVYPDDRIKNYYRILLKHTKKLLRLYYMYKVLKNKGTIQQAIMYYLDYIKLLIAFIYDDLFYYN